MTLVKTSICAFTVVVSLGFFAPSNAQTESEKDLPPSVGPELICAEQCAVDRDAALKQCDIIYDDGLCFGYLPCLDDTEVALRQCENIADTIFSGCASRCYRNLLERAADE